jgi:hypothetical protein
MPDTSPRDREYNVRNEARRATHRIAIDAGAQTITRPIFVGADTTVRDVEPAAGLRAARGLELAARSLALGYVRQAREAGHTWHGITSPPTATSPATPPPRLPSTTRPGTPTRITPAPTAAPSPGPAPPAATPSATTAWTTAPPTTNAATPPTASA